MTRMLRTPSRRQYSEAMPMARVLDDQKLEVQLDPFTEIVISSPVYGLSEYHLLHFQCCCYCVIIYITWFILFLSVILM